MRDSGDGAFRIWEPIFTHSSAPRPPPEPPRSPRRRTPSPPESDFSLKDKQTRERKGIQHDQGVLLAHGRPNTAAAPTLPPVPEVEPRAQPTPKRRSLAPRRRGKVNVPPAVEKLLRAKLYRMAVFHIIRTPELMTNASLLVHVINVLEANGAGKLADRLRTTMDLRTRADVDTNEPARLWSNPGSSEVQRPSTWWRLPVIPRAVESYPEATVTERRTHYYNHLITSFLTKQHSAPYASPVRASERGPRPPLRNMKCVLKYVDHLREKQGFVPDRVTVNIIIKAWLNTMARNTEGHGDHARTHYDRQGLGAEELRGIFDVVATTVEQDISELAKTGDLGKANVTITSVAPVLPAASAPPAEAAVAKAGPAEVTPGGATAGTAQPTPFNRAINYEHHVKPFGNMMRRAFARVGDHTGRIATERWMYRVAQRLGVPNEQLHASVRRAGEEMKKQQQK